MCFCFGLGFFVCVFVCLFVCKDNCCGFSPSSDKSVWRVVGNEKQRPPPPPPPPSPPSLSSCCFLLTCVSVFLPTSLPLLSPSNAVSTHMYPADFYNICWTHAVMLLLNTCLTLFPVIVHCFLRFSNLLSAGAPIQFV